MPSLQSLIILVAAAAALSFAAGTPAVAGSAEIKALQYDAQGRVIGIRRGEVPERPPAGAGPPAPAPATRNPDDPRSWYRRGELMVVAPSAAFEDAVRRLGYRVIEQTALPTLRLRMVRLAIPAGLTEEQALSRLRRRFPGLVTDLHQTFEPSAKPPVNDSHARTRIGWPALPAACAEGVRLGMIDAAIDLSHPALAGQRIEYRSFHDPAREPGSAMHGTAIAAMMAGRPSPAGWGGLLPGVELKAANMFEADEAEQIVGSALALYRAVDWMIDEQVAVLNLSIAGSDNAVTRRVFRRAHARGIVMVAAAGNWASSTRPAYPAAYPEVVAVTAVGEGRTVYRYANRGSYIDFAAPGVQLWTAVPGGGRYQSGTSFAVPYVSVLMALELARGAIPDSAVLRHILRRNAIDLGAPGRDEVYGWGLVGKRPTCLE